MVRSPCYDKNGRKKGAWSPEEDDKLRAYVQRFGHWNWRELPKFAGRKETSFFFFNFFPAEVFREPNIKRVCLSMQFQFWLFRAFQMWEELQTEMVELSATQCQERKLHRGRRGNNQEITH